MPTDELLMYSHYHCKTGGRREPGSSLISPLLFTCLCRDKELKQRRIIYTLFCHIFAADPLSGATVNNVANKTELKRRSKPCKLGLTSRHRGKVNNTAGGHRIAKQLAAGCVFVGKRAN